MVEINISVKATSEAPLQDILNHVVKEITNEEYRLSKSNECRKVDMNWVYMEEGQYQWNRNDRS